MSDNTINAALRAIGYAGNEKPAHGFRSMADGLLNETGLFNPDAIERQLAHKQKKSKRRIHMRDEFWAERVRIMQFWSDYLEQLRDHIPSARNRSHAAAGRPKFGQASPQPRYRREAQDRNLDAARCRVLERRYAISYLAFVLPLGTFGSHIFPLPEPEAHMLTICLLVGYCAGVAVGAGLRPKIAIPAMILALSPAIAISHLRHEAIYVGMGVIAAALLAGGIHSAVSRHRIAKLEIGKRISLGRSPAPTG